MSAQIIQFSAAEPEPLDQRAREHEADDYPAEAYDVDEPPPLPLDNWMHDTFEWVAARVGRPVASALVGLLLLFLWGLAGWITGGGQ